MLSTFDLYQQVFTLSVMANWAGTWQMFAPPPRPATSAELARELTIKIDDALASPRLQDLIGVWTRVWGPAIYQHDHSGVADNAMYVARGTDGNDNPVHVVAVAGTNAASRYDVHTENADVRTLAPLPNDPSGPPIISQGTSFGVKHLESMAHPDHATGAPEMTLVQYLNGLCGTGGTVIFTGHSLGGRLSPALAVDLVRHGGLRTGNFTEIYVYPTAGPTPGTGAFAALFRDAFPLIATGSNSYQSWNGLVWNILDVIPHAWQESTLAQIPSLYEPEIPSPACISTLAAHLGNHVLGRGYMQLQSCGPMPGAFHRFRPALSGSLCAFVQQAYFQHIGAYFEMLGVNQLLETGFFVLETLPPDFCTTFEQRFC